MEKSDLTLTGNAKIRTDDLRALASRLLDDVTRASPAAPDSSKGAVRAR